ncbi:unnamed protein product [Camellia sinensis]
MGERKVLNKYYPSNFDPAKILKRRQPKNQQMKVQMMLPMSIRCGTCSNYIYKGTKFNSRKEDVICETYLGIQIFKFYFKCTKCSAELTIKTDPQNSDYVVELGASRVLKSGCGRHNGGGNAVAVAGCKGRSVTVAVIGTTYLGIQIFKFYFKCTKCSAELTIKTDPQNSDYVVELGASRNFEPWRAVDEEANKEKQKRKTEEMEDAMKSLENRTLDSKREMDILAALDEVKSMRSRQATISVDAMLEVLQRSAEEKEKKLEEEDEALIKSLFGAPREVVRRIDDDILDDDEDLSQISTDNAETSKNNSKRRKVSEELPTNRFLKNFPLSQQII